MIDSRWMTVEEFKAVGFPSTTPVNISTCRVTGVKYVAVIIGRFRKLSEDELRRKYEEFLNALPDGCSISGETKNPLWVQVEFLANMIDFETNPPCGCNPELT